MAKEKHKDSKAVEEEEVEEGDKEEMTGLKICPKSTLETSNVEVVGGGRQLNPKGENSRLLLSDKSWKDLNGSHTVTCTFTVSLAVPVLPTGQKQKKSTPAGMGGKRIQADESRAVPKTQRSYHIEYFLLPDDLVPRKLDLTLVGVVAKLRTESDSMAITPWFENDKMWLSWNHGFDICVTNEYLIKLRDHKIILNIWDAKDKVSSKAKLTKPNVISSVGRVEAVDGVEHTVLLQRKFLEESQPAPSCTKFKAKKKSKAQESSALPVEEETDVNGQTTSHCGLPHPPRGDGSGRVRNVTSAKTTLLDKTPVNSTSKDAMSASHDVGVLRYEANKLANANDKASAAGICDGLLLLGKDWIWAKKNFGNNCSAFRKMTDINEFIFMVSSVQPCLPSPGRRGSGPKKTMDAPQAKKCDVASLQFDLMPLLAGEKTVTSRLTEDNPKVVDVYATFAVETPLLSERQRHELNPLVIRIHSATCLPNTPVPIEELQRLCVPTYCKYKFHNFPPHRTHGQVHGTHVYFKDVNVLLTGMMEPGDLQKCLRGPPLEIEVHDRDRNTENNTEKPCLSGEDGGDEELDLWHPHGVVKINLTELLLGRKYLAISAPILSCSTPNTAPSSEEDKKKKISESALPMGHYLESDSLLKVRVEIAVPLRMHAEAADAQVTSCPYGCIIYIFDYNNSSLLHDLVEEITEINAQALQLDCGPVHLIGMALAASKLETTLEKVSELDIVTGFHLLDGATHLFVLEGLKEKAIKRLWDRHFERTHRQEGGQLEILYDSQLSFHRRLYTDLEAIFYHCRLRKPLFTTAKQPLLYVRGTVPWACFQALSRLSYLHHSKRLRDVVHRELLPSAEMITALSHKYGASLALEDLCPQKPPLLLVSSGDHTALRHVSRVRRAVHSSPGDRNEKRALQKSERAGRKSFERNHLGTNKGKMKKPNFETFRISPVDGKSVFNYSCQSLNSAELAKQQLRQEIAKEPKKIFTYCHQYLSATFEPVDVAVAHKEAFAKSKSMWLSPNGFVLSGFKSSTESNRHPQMPDEARWKELSETLFGNLQRKVRRCCAAADSASVQLQRLLGDKAGKASLRKAVVKEQL